MNDNFEFVSRDEMISYQNSLLKKTIIHSLNTKFYKEKFSKIGIDPSEINSVEDLKKIPLTTKEELRKYSLEDRIAVSSTKIIIKHASSGSSGEPVWQAYTKKDLELAAYSMSMCFSMQGYKKNDVLLYCLPNSPAIGGKDEDDSFSGGHIARIGAENFGLNVINLGLHKGTTEKLLEILLSKKYKSPSLGCLVTYLGVLENACLLKGVNPSDLNLSKISTGSQLLSTEKRKYFEDTFNCPIYNIYGSVESWGPGFASECIYQNGLHFNEGMYILELVDDNDMNIDTKNESEGNLVITSLKKDATPLIRYKTNDIVRFLKDEKCDCGRTLRRAIILGRADDLKKINGTLISPLAIENNLLKINGVGKDFELIITNKENSTIDYIELIVEYDNKYLGSFDDLKNSIMRKLKELKLGHYCQIKFVEPGYFSTIQKIKRALIVDKRK